MVKQQWMSHRDRDQGHSCLENFNVKLKKLKFSNKKKDRLGFSQKCLMLGEMI